LNFEGLIDIIEQCLQFWSTKNTTATIGNVLINVENEFWENAINYQYANSERDFAGERNLSHESKFFAKLLIDIIEGIADKILNYSFYTYNQNKIIEEQENTAILDLTTEYIKKLAKNRFLRFYSLNY